MCCLLHALQLKGTVFGLRSMIPSAKLVFPTLSCFPYFHLFVFADCFNVDHELVGIFTTTVSVVPSAAVVVISCGS